MNTGSMPDENAEIPIPEALTQGRWQYSIRIDRPAPPNQVFSWNVDRERTDLRFGAGEAGVAFGITETWNEAVREAAEGRDKLMAQNRKTDEA